MPLQKEDVTFRKARTGSPITAKNGEYVPSVYKEAFTDYDNLTYDMRDDGTVLISRFGVPIGFTTPDALQKR